MLCLPKPPALEAVHDIWLKHFRSKLQPGKSGRERLCAESAR